MNPPRLATPNTFAQDILIMEERILGRKPGEVRHRAGCMSMTGGYSDRPHHTEMLVSLNGSDARGSGCLGGSHWHWPPSR